MNLYIIRHTDASSEGSNTGRRLTFLGKQKLLTKIISWEESHIKFKFVLSSPLIRARQTTEIIKEHFHHSIQLQVEQCLKPGCSPSELEVLLQLFDFENIAVVGHEPDCSSFVSYFCKIYPPDLYFEPAGLAHINFRTRAERGKGNLICIK